MLSLFEWHFIDFEKEIIVFFRYRFLSSCLQSGDFIYFLFIGQKPDQFSMLFSHSHKWMVIGIDDDYDDERHLLLFPQIADFAFERIQVSQKFSFV